MTQRKEFKVGDKVIALTDPADKTCQKRIKGHIYAVVALLYCTVDGHQSVNIGEKSISTLFKCHCGHLHPTHAMAWTRSIHFVKADAESIENAMLESVGSEDYETAAMLRDIKI